MISIDHLDKLADFYKVDVSYIVKGYQYPRDVQNVTFSAEDNHEDAEFWEIFKKLTKEQKAEILEFMKFRLSKN